MRKGDKITDWLRLCQWTTRSVFVPAIVVVFFPHLRWKVALLMGCRAVEIPSIIDGVLVGGDHHHLLLLPSNILILFPPLLLEE